jgi:hypothetical protein
VNREDVNRWAYAVLLTVIVCILALLAGAVLEAKGDCERRGGAYVQGLFGFTCVGRR